MVTHTTKEPKKERKNKMDLFPLQLLKILVEMERDTGKSDEEILEELLSVKIEDIGVDFDRLETIHGTIVFIKPGVKMSLIKDWMPCAVHGNQHINTDGHCIICLKGKEK